jgi:hypothetical protein
LTLNYIYTSPNPLSAPADNTIGHGSCMMSKIAGKTIGVARNAQVFTTVIDYNNFIYENFLDGILKVYDHIVANGNGKKAVVNMSVGFQLVVQVNQSFINKLGQFSPLGVVPPG